MLYAYFQPKKPDTTSAGVIILNESGQFIEWRGVTGKTEVRKVVRQIGAICMF